MAAVVASTMSKGTVRSPKPGQVHADPRAHMERDAQVNDIEGTLADEERLRLEREERANREWEQPAVVDAAADEDEVLVSWIDEEVEG